MRFIKKIKEESVGLINKNSWNKARTATEGVA